MAGKSEYLPRVIDSEIATALAGPLAVVIEGAKGVGKTATATHHAKSSVLLDVDQQARVAALIDASLVLAGDKPRLIDEWQEAPELWNHIRRAVDARDGPFILTGSTVPADEVSRHTGAGRFSWTRMRPMSLTELGRSSGEVSLAKLLDGEGTSASSRDLSLAELAELTCIGGWPALLNSDLDDARRFLRGYLDSVARTDVQRVDGIARDPQKVRRVLRSLARNVATEATITTIARDVGGTDEAVDADTARSYIRALERIMVVEDQPAWAPRLRSRSRIRSAPKRHFCDPSLAAAALQVTPAGLLRDLNYFGFLFESLAVRDLRIYAQHSHGEVFHYRDNIGEVDVIVDAGDRWGAIEVKLGIGFADEAAANLKRFVERVDTEHRGAPSFLAVITPAPYGYVRADGVHVVPLHGLGP